MDHQKEAVKFLWKNTMGGVLAHQTRLLKEAAKAAAKANCVEGQTGNGEGVGDGEQDASQGQLSQDSDDFCQPQPQEHKKCEDIREMLTKPSKRPNQSQQKLAKVAAGGGCVIAHCMGSGVCVCNLCRSVSNIS